MKKGLAWSLVLKCKYVELLLSPLVQKHHEIAQPLKLCAQHLKFADRLASAAGMYIAACAMIMRQISNTSAR